MLHLKQSTASQSVLIGPFIDDTDGKTAETGLTIANTDIRLSKNGGNMAAKTSGGGTHDEAGWYAITLDATDTNTVGRLQASVDVAGALPVWAEFQVVEEDVYEFFYASGSTPDADVAAILVDTGSLNDTKIPDTISLAAINAECDTALTDYDAVIPADLNDPTAATIAAAVWDLDATSHQTLGTFGQAIGDPVADATTIYQAVVTDAAGDNVAVDVVAVKAETALIVADTNELQTDDVPGLIAALNDPTAVVVAAAVWDLDATTHQTGGTFGQAIGDPGANTETMYDAVVTDAAGTNVAVDVVAVKAETVLIVADTNELQTDDVPTLIAAVQSDTDDIQTRLPDALVGGSIKADMLAISGDTAAADKLEESATSIDNSTAKAGTLSTTQMSTNLSETTDDHYIGRTVIWTTGVLAFQASDITDYVGVNGVLTFSAVTEAPSAGDAFVIV